MRKNCSSDQEKVLKFEAEGREFAKILRSLEQFIQTAFQVDFRLGTYVKLFITIGLNCCSLLSLYEVTAFSINTTKLKLLKLSMCLNRIVNYNIASSSYKDFAKVIKAIRKVAGCWQQHPVVSG